MQSRALPRAVFGLCVIAILLSAWIADRVLHRFPNSADEYAYLFQADTFCKGRLWNDAHPAAPFFEMPHIAQKDGKWVSRFPPGWPAVLALARLVHVPPWRVNPLLAGASLWILYLLGRELFGGKVAAISVLAVMSSSFFLFNAASFFSHVSMLLMVLLMYYGSVLYFRRGGRKYALFTGFLFSCAFVTRSLTALVLLAPLACHFLTAHRDKLWRATLWFVAGALPVGILYVAYNRAITGQWLLLVTRWVDPEEGLGWVRGHSFARGLRYTGRHLADLLTWTTPALACWMLLPFASLRRDNKWPFFLMLGLPLVVLAYVFYWSRGGNQYGPRFYFEAFPLAVLGIVAALFGEPARFPFQRTVAAVFLISLAWTLYIFPKKAGRYDAIVTERQEVYRLAEERQLDDAIVLIGDIGGMSMRTARGDLVRNGTTLDQPVLYALDRGNENATLREHFPNREFRLYTRPTGEKTGKLEPIDL